MPVAIHLYEPELCPSKDALRSLQCLHLLGALILAIIVVRHQPIALLMQIHDDLLGVFQLTAQQIALPAQNAVVLGHLGHGGDAHGEGLGIGLALLCGDLHELFVLCLIGRLVGLFLGDLLLHVALNLGDHLDDTSALCLQLRRSRSALGVVSVSAIGGVVAVRAVGCVVGSEETELRLVRSRSRGLGERCLLWVLLLPLQLLLLQELRAVVLRQALARDAEEPQGLVDVRQVLQEELVAVLALLREVLH
mmetsp:Transcript_67535/g.218249  ORF Transcript_67535/g.218249 Transcript_67535/m.218249 type:complete len:250 (+) Transcript_67535:118-867(+)